MILRGALTMAAEYVCRPEDTEERVVGMVVEAVREHTRQGQPAAVTVKRYRPKRTDPQVRTIWMWHGEVAAELSHRCREAGFNVQWTKDDVHETLFKQRHMAQRETVLPDGECRYRAYGLSDRDTTRQMVSDAMEDYLRWIYQNGIEVTIPADPLVEQVVGNIKL